MLRSPSPNPITALVLSVSVIQLAILFGASDVRAASSEKTPVGPLDGPVTIIETNALEPQAAEVTLEERQAEREALESREDERDDREEDKPGSTQLEELPVPCTGPWDWVRLSSGEWLRGDLKRMRDKKLEFKSKRLKTQTIKWKHVRELCLPNPTRFILYDHTVLMGSATLQGTTLTVLSEDATQTALRSDIWGILPGRASELNRWSSRWSIGLDTFSGNTNQSSFNANIEIKREAAQTEFSLAYIGNFATVNSAENVNKHRLTQGFDRDLTRVWYVTVAYLSYNVDKFQNLRNRVAPATGFGAHVFDTDIFEWDVELGASYQFTEYISVVPGQALEANDWGGRASMRLSWDIITDLTFTASHSSVLVATDFGQSNYHSRAALSYEITDLLFLEFSFSHDRVQQPVANSSNITPKPDDFHYVASIGFTFD